MAGANQFYEPSVTHLATSTNKQNPVLAVRVMPCYLLEGSLGPQLGVPWNA